ncbi:19887_t:CDS:2, partial [Dentiscutata erythropus]
DVQTLSMLIIVGLLILLGSIALLIGLNITCSCSSILNFQNGS